MPEVLVLRAQNKKARHREKIAKIIWRLPLASKIALLLSLPTAPEKERNKVNKVIRGAIATLVMASPVPFTTAITAGTAVASNGVVPCSSPATAQYFKQWGDSNYYFLAPGASFQSGAAYSWTMSGGATTTSGGDPWNVTKTASPASALIPPGGAATSWTMCVNSTQTALRFFYKSPGVNGSALQVYVKVTAGVNVAINTDAFNGNSSGWAVANIVNLPAMFDSNGQEDVYISFYPINVLATWQVDNVMIDPFASN